jgi:hypothetical protein
MRHPVDFAVQVLARNLQWIAVADGKVGPNLAIATAMFGILAAIVPGASSRAPRYGFPFPQRDPLADQRQLVLFATNLIKTSGDPV